MTPSAGTLKKLDVGYVLRNGPSGASSGFLRNDGVGGSGLPLRKSSTPGAILDSDGTPTDTDADTGDTLKLAILGQTDNAGVIRDELEPELRTPDIVLAGTTEVWMLSPVSLIRDVSTRYGGVTPEKLFTYASGTNTPRTPTSVQIRDSDRNGLDDVLLSFKKGISESNEIYRSIIYAYTNFGTTPSRRRQRCANCAPSALATPLAPSTSAPTTSTTSGSRSKSSRRRAARPTPTMATAPSRCSSRTWTSTATTTSSMRPSSAKARASRSRARSTWPTSPRAPRPSAAPG